MKRLVVLLVLTLAGCGLRPKGVRDVRPFTPERCYGYAIAEDDSRIVLTCGVNPASDDKIKEALAEMDCPCAVEYLGLAWRVYPYGDPDAYQD